MKLTYSVVILLTALATHAFAQPSEFAAGRASYRDGEYRKAVAHFQRALQGDPSDAASHYWMGRSYETLADIAAPFGGKYRSRARTYLTRATELAPGEPEYRRELFDFLLDFDGFSRSERQQALRIVLASAESDLDYDYMRARFEQARSVNSSAGARLTKLILIVPRAAFRVAAAGR